jgi:hypothetical protein
MKNKTLAVWMCFLGGPLGLHRFYLRGKGDPLGWVLPVPTALGMYGVQRLRHFGVDDGLSWALVPILGFVIAACALTAIVYGLMTPEAWNARFNAQTGSAAGLASAGATGWLTIAAVVVALMVGATTLIASIAFAFEGYFNAQVEASRILSQ